MKTPRRAFTLVETLITLAIAVALGLPLIAIVRVSDNQTIVSEDYMFAETLAQRELAKALAIPWDELSLPLEKRLETRPCEQKAIRKEFPAFAKNLQGENSFEAKLWIEELEEGLLLYRIRIDWGARSHVLSRFRCLPTLSLTKTFSSRASLSKRKELRKLK